MNRTIKEFNIAPNFVRWGDDEVYEIDIPEDAWFLGMAAQYGMLKMWWEVDTDSKLVKRKFKLFRPGAENMTPDDGLHHKGTVHFAFRNDAPITTFVYECTNEGVPYVKGYIKGKAPSNA